MPEVIVVKAFRGIALNRWLVRVCGDVAVLTDGAGASRIERGDEPEHAVGFPKSDVFWPPSERISDGEVPDWAKMRRRF